LTLLLVASRLPKAASTRGTVFNVSWAASQMTHLPRRRP
jgi:hypothetical protein